MLITSSTNPTFKRLLRLAHARGRKQSGAFIIEGKRELLRASQSKVVIQCVALSETMSQSAYFEETFLDALKAKECYIFSDELFSKLSAREHPDGVLGVAQKWDCSFSDLKFKKNGLYLLVEGIEKPGNLGALLRSAEATAVDAVFLADLLVDLFNPNVIRASQGAFFNLKIYWHTSEYFLKLFRQANLQVLATTPHAQQDYWSCDLTQSSVICVGNEASGLSELWLTEAKGIRIPIYGQSADSLNAGVAGALCLYEARRQRQR